MKNTGIGHFDNTVNKTIQWIADVQRALGWERIDRAYTATKAVLHTLRDRLTIDESFQLGAQLPMLMKGFYYDGYVPSHKPKKIKKKKDFYKEVENKMGRIVVDGEVLTKAVLKMLKKHVKGGELRDIKNMMPEDLKDLL